MVLIFTETTSLLAPEFVSSLPAEKLAFTLFKISKDAGVEFNQVKKTFSVVGDWNKVIKAHSYLEKYFETENNALESDFGQTDAASNNVNSGPNNDGRRGRKPGCTVAKTSHSVIPEPYVHYQNPSGPKLEKTEKPKLEKTEKPNPVPNEKPSPVLNSEISNQIEPLDNTEDVHIVAEQNLPSNNDETNNLKESSDVTENEMDADGIVKVKEEFDNDVMDDETDVDEQYIDVGNTESQADFSKNNSSFEQNVTVKVENPGDEIGVEQTKSRRKSKPRRYKQAEETNESDEELGDEQVVVTKRKKGRPKLEDASNGNEKKKIDVKNQKVIKKKSRKNKIADKNEVKKTPTMIEATDGNTFKCDKCEYVGKKKENLKEHTKRMHRNRFTCDVCLKPFGLHKDLLRHTRHVHTNPAYHCIVCDKSYKFSRAYKEHMQSHKEDYIKPQFECEICHKTFSTKYVLTAHIKSEHLGMKKSFVCPTCGRSFTQKNSYLMHANVHAGIKPYVCDVCGKAFSYDKSLKEHKYMHDEERRFSCHVCAKTFRQKTSLLMHMKVHKEERDYICTSCGKGFTQKQALLRHERIHSGDKPFKCALCSRAFNDYSIIRRHMMMHHKRDKDPKTWRGDIICSLKRKTEFYISGGPGYNGGDRIPTQEGSGEDDSLNYSDDNSTEKLVKSKNKEKPKKRKVEVPEQNQEGVSVTQGESMVQYSDSMDNSGMSSAYQVQNMTELQNVDSKIEETVQRASPTLPLNYSLPVIYPQSVPVTSGSSSNNQEMERQYHEMLDYRIHGQRREMFMPNLTTMAPIPGLPPHTHGHHLTTVSEDTSQTSTLPNHWSFSGYPPYYNPSNFPQFQGPQS